MSDEYPHCTSCDEYAKENAALLTRVNELTARIDKMVDMNRAQRDAAIEDHQRAGRTTAKDFKDPGIIIPVPHFAHVVKIDVSNCRECDFYVLGDQEYVEEDHCALAWAVDSDDDFGKPWLREGEPAPEWCPARQGVKIEAA